MPLLATDALAVGITEELIKPHIGDMPTLTGIEHRAQPSPDAFEIAARRQHLASTSHD